MQSDSSAASLVPRLSCLPSRQVRGNLFCSEGTAGAKALWQENVVCFEKARKSGQTRASLNCARHVFHLSAIGWEFLPVTRK